MAPRADAAGRAFRWGRALPLLLVVTGLALAALPVVTHAIGTWGVDSELSFGFLVPPIAAGLAWLRRPLRDEPSPRSWSGLVPILGGLILLLVGTRAGIHALTALATLPVGLGVVWTVWGRAWVRTLWIPLILLTASFVLYRGLLSPLGFAMQQLSATLAALGASVVGLPVTQVGLNLYAPGVHLIVAEACSGMDSLLALLCLGGVLVGLAPGRPGRRLLLLLLILPVILVANVIRIALVLVLGGSLGAVVEQGLGHAAVSALLFALACGLLLGLAYLLECPPTLRRHSSPAL